MSVQGWLPPAERKWQCTCPRLSIIPLFVEQSAKGWVPTYPSPPTATPAHTARRTAGGTQPQGGRLATLRAFIDRQWTQLGRYQNLRSCSYPASSFTPPRPRHHHVGPRCVPSLAAQAMHAHCGPDSARCRCSRSPTVVVMVAVSGFSVRTYGSGSAVLVGGQVPCH